MSVGAISERLRQIRRAIVLPLADAAASRKTSDDGDAKKSRLTAPAARVVVVGSLSELDSITRRGLLPSLPAGSRIRLTLVPDDRPERIRWEHSLTRHASACGCELAAVVLTLVLAALVVAHIVGGTTVGLPGLPVVVSWAMLGIASVFLVKLAVSYAARRSLEQLRLKIAAAARATRSG
jgi:hypothetical protein